MHCSIICYLCSSETSHVYISISWIPDVVSFLSRSYFFPGPRFTCVVSRMCAGNQVKYNCRRHFLVCLAHCWCKAFSYQVSSIPHMRPHLCFIRFMDPSCGKFPYRVPFLSQSQIHMCGKSFATYIVL
jgi:hypothetical protein